jgi:phosphohistidine phosphatase
MARELFILRHGKSDWSAGTDDFHRPLKKRGKRGAGQIAAWLRRQGLIPDHIISSPATRAIDTARRVCEALHLTTTGVDTDEGIYEASAEQLLRVLSGCPQHASRVLLVGHNPGLEELLLYLAPTPPVIPNNGKLLPTAALARMLMPDDWQSIARGSARLLNLTRPTSLKNSTTE